VATGLPASGDDDDPMSEINVTPLVDVVLVLLVIFMVTAPMLKSALDVQLPEVSTSTPATAQTIVVMVDARGRLAVDGKETTLEEAVTRLRSRAAGDSVFLGADKGAAYGEVIHVLDAFRKAGVENVSLMTQAVPEPRAGGRREGAPR
jgi:biopolymer transport protein ExbD